MKFQKVVVIAVADENMPLKSLIINEKCAH